METLESIEATGQEGRVSNTLEYTARMDDDLDEILKQLDCVIRSRPAMLHDNAMKVLRKLLQGMQKHVAENTEAPYSPPDKFGIDEFE